MKTRSSTPTQRPLGQHRSHLYLLCSLIRQGRQQEETSEHSESIIDAVEASSAVSGSLIADATRQLVSELNATIVSLRDQVLQLETELSHSQVCFCFLTYFDQQAAHQSMLSDKVAETTDVHEHSAAQIAGLTVVFLFPSPCHAAGALKETTGRGSAAAADIVRP
jgi:hypothetical protein